MIAAVIIALYFWTYFSKTIDVDDILTVNIPAVILASATLLVSFISYLWTPKKHIFSISLVIYLLLTATTATLIVSTGNITSPFVALWMLISIFAGIFGLWGSMPILILTAVFIAIQYIDKNLTITTLFITTFSSLLPLIAGSIIWHGKSAKDEVDNDNKAYRNLANELSEVAGKSEVVINAIGDGVIAIDSQGVIQLINPAAQDIIGWGKQDALALNYKSVLKLVNQRDETLDPVEDPIQQALNSNQEIRTNNLNLITGSGNKLMVSLVASPVGAIGSGVITVFHDVTKEKADEREQAEFISTASHEMRTPVASIEGYLGLALNFQTATIDERARDFIMKAHDSAEHLGHLFQDLLDVTKSDDGRLSNNPTVVNIVIFIHDLVQGLKQNAADKGLRLIYKPLPDQTTERFIAPPYYVNLDNNHIREIINNLVENAIKYTLKGEIVIDITGDDERVIVSVKDSGIGIPAEDMSHLFQKFYRVDNKATRAIGGTGLGLYLCRRLAEMMGGSIWAESTYNNGSTFFLELPRISSQEANQISEKEAVSALQETNRKTNLPPNETSPIIPPPIVNPAPIIPAVVVPPPVVIPPPVTSPTPIITPVVAPPVISPPSIISPAVVPLPVVTPPVIIPTPNPIMAPPIKQTPVVLPPITPTPITIPIIEPTPVARPIPVQKIITDISKPTPIESRRPVPRGQDLTSNQIADYVAKQSQLAQQQAKPQLSRPKPITITDKITNQ